MIKNMDYKTEIKGLRMNRRKIANELGITYNALSARLSGFQRWQDGEEDQLKKIIAKAKK